MQNSHLAILQKLKKELPYYAKHCLKIKTKTGEVVAFDFNRAQKHIHSRLEEQKKRTGKVRAVIVKGRQQGASTYIAGRFFHQASLTPGLSVYILAHISDSTRHLFEMAKRFYENAPPAIVPKIETLNERRLVFGGIASDYGIGTAGSVSIGRGLTIQRFHGSEVAFWENTDEIMTGVLQAVPDALGTEIIFESTANGVGNMFHKLAVSGIGDNPEGDFITVFVPWFWQPEYSKHAPSDFTTTDEEEQLIRMYELTPDQIYWRRRKIMDAFSGDVWKFRQEYPCSAQEAFVVSGVTLLSAEQVMLARKCTAHDMASPVVIGCDPARTKDRTVVVIRRGREVIRWLKYDTMDEMTLAGILASLIDRHGAQKCFIDTGYGYGTIDRLRELGYGQVVTGVHFGGKAMQPEVYLNKRAEMADAVREWFAEGGVRIPDEDEIHLDLLAIPPLRATGSRGVLALPPKEKIIELFGKSPDIFDALCFVGGTLITIPKGRVPIEDIKPGDYVITPFGSRRVLLTHESIATELTTATFSNGAVLTGKPGHKIFSFFSGLVSLSTLSLDNEIELDNITRRFLWKWHRLWCTKRKHFGFKQRATTINPMTKVNRKDFCTGEFTATISGRLPKGCMSITKTETGRIIASKTLNSWWLLSTLGNTWHFARKLKKRVFGVERFSLQLCPPDGSTARPLATNGKATEDTKTRLKNARNAGRSLNSADTVRNNAVPEYVPISTAGKRFRARLSQNLVSARNAVGNLFLAAFGFKPVVPVDVQTRIANAVKTHNLTVDVDNVYYANGILVENCLTMAYPVASAAVNTRIKRADLDVRRSSSPLSTVRDFNRTQNSGRKIISAKLDFLK